MKKRFRKSEKRDIIKLEIYSLHFSRFGITLRRCQLFADNPQNLNKWENGVTMEKENNTELMRVVNLERIYNDKAYYVVIASKEECERLAKRFNLVAVESLEARYEIDPAKTSRGGYHLRGKLHGAVVQSCVVTLAPVREAVDTDIDLQVVDKRYEDLDPLDPELEEDFEYSIQDEIDLGEITAQYLSLSLNPYPRAPDVDANKVLGEFQDKKNPFAVLEKLKP